MQARQHRVNGTAWRVLLTGKQEAAAAQGLHSATGDTHPPSSNTPTPAAISAFTVTRGTFRRKRLPPREEIIAGSSSLYCSVGRRMYASSEREPPRSCGVAEQDKGEGGKMPA